MMSGDSHVDLTQVSSPSITQFFRYCANASRDICGAAAVGNGGAAHGSGCAYAGHRTCWSGYAYEQRSIHHA
jgi:hypothetical protein